MAFALGCTAIGGFKFGGILAIVELIHAFESVCTVVTLVPFFAHHGVKVLRPKAVVREERAHVLPCKNIAAEGASLDPPSAVVLNTLILLILVCVSHPIYYLNPFFFSPSSVVTQLRDH